MSRGERLSVLGLYHFNNDLFNGMRFPSQFTDSQKQTVINNILAECAELEVLYPDYNTMSFMIDAWSSIELPVWQRIYSASLLEYDPIENYNRMETETLSDVKKETHSGKDINSNTTNKTDTHSGTDTSSNSSEISETHSGNDVDTKDVTAYDSGTLYTQEKNTRQNGHKIDTDNSASGSYVYGHKINTAGTDSNELSHGEIIDNTGTTTKTSTIHGNIGVTTSQQMLEQEINIASLLNVSKIIVESFKERFCLLVY